ncbi:MAG: 16S rRNA (uracil(1498)-N(3))-methyltransferase [Flavobacteriaceae bacterium]|nr:16S rRNA (uracil(1498)-N(3))-methyltransferase [Flavobacteriaceae bacterium]
MQLFYNSEINEDTSTFSFSKEESKHIVKVLRKQEGDTLYITNGKGYLFEVEIIISSIKKCSAKITSKTFKKNKTYKLHLAVAPTKMNDRYEWFLEKATEIGIDSITPIICDHSERKIVKLERFEKIVQSAMKQSLQYYLPKVNDAISYKTFMTREFKGQKYIAHCEPSQKTPLKLVLKSQEAVTILIGPEGDFSVKEIEMALEHDFIPVTLGNTRLRTETAAIAACHSVAFINDSNEI